MKIVILKLLNRSPPNYFRGAVIQSAPFFSSILTCQSATSTFDNALCVTVDNTRRIQDCLINYFYGIWLPQDYQNLVEC